MAPALIVGSDFRERSTTGGRMDLWRQGAGIADHLPGDVREGRLGPRIPSRAGWGRSLTAQA